MVEDPFKKMNPAVIWDELGGRGSAGSGKAPAQELVRVVRRWPVPESSRLAGAKEKQEVRPQKMGEGRFRVWCMNTPKTTPKTEHKKDTGKEG